MIRIEKRNDGPTIYWVQQKVHTQYPRYDVLVDISGWQDNGFSNAYYEATGLGSFWRALHVAIQASRRTGLPLCRSW